jgi:anti-repressor protein
LQNDKLAKNYWNDWIERRLYDSWIVENIDYCSVLKVEKREIGATKRMEYFLSIDATKHISLMDKTLEK